jgi:hypothetical protein
MQRGCFSTESCGWVEKGKGLHVEKPLYRRGRCAAECRRAGRCVNLVRGADLHSGVLCVRCWECPSVWTSAALS